MSWRDRICKLRLLTWFPLLAFSVAGVVITLVYTRHGPGLSGDSMIYIQGAKGLLAGRGYSALSGGGDVQPITAFPPLTSISLALVGVGGGNLVTAGRWLNVLLFGLNIFLAGWLIRRYTGSMPAAWLGAAMLLAQKSLIVAHSWVMSESLFIFVVLLAFIAIGTALDTGKWQWLALGGVLSGLTVLSRYAGLALLPAACLAIVLCTRSGWKQRLGKAALFGAASILPLALWFGRNMLVGGTVANRSISEQMLRKESFGLLVDTVLSWSYLMNLGLKWRARIIVFVLLMLALTAAFAVRYWREYFRKGAPSPKAAFQDLAWVWIFFFPLYLAVVWFSLARLDPATSESSIVRYVMPLFVVWVMLVIGLLVRIVDGSRRERWIKVALSIVGIGLVAYYAQTSVTTLPKRTFVFGYTDNLRAWPEEIALLRNLDPTRPLITNNPELLYALAERYSYALPVRVDPADQEASLRQQLAAGALLVEFPGRGTDAQHQLVEQLAETLVVVDQASHVIVYAHSGTP